MKCPRCNTINHEEGARFCHVCGAMLQTENNEASTEASAIASKWSRGSSQPVSVNGTSRMELSPVRTFNVNGVSFNMILVEGETFWMGEQKENPSKPNYDLEACANNVRQEKVDTFYIGETMVTQDLAPIHLLAESEFVLL